MKRAVFLLLCLLLILPALCPPLAAEGPVEIFDAAGLAAIADDPEGDYVLAADIDLGGLDWTPLAFSGTLDGRDHTIYNLTVSAPGAETRTTRDGNLKPYDTVFAGLFSVLEGAEVRDVHLKGAYVSVETEAHCFAALLAGCIDHSSITGCSVEGRAAMIGRSVMVGVGGLAGYGCGSITDCRADVELFFEDRCFERRCEQFMGGILSCGVADIERCTVDIAGYDSCHGYVHDGGLVGMYDLCGMDYPYCSVSENYVSGFISFFEDNTDRRAYCRPFRGEYLTGLRRYDGNSHDFERRESFDYSRVLLPESCESPEIVEEITPSSCTDWGFTRHVCRLCGHEWTDSYTPPAHSPGEWRCVREADYGVEGREEKRCTVCGELLGERVLGALIPTESCRIVSPAAALAPGESVLFTAELLPADATERGLRWSSSDETVAVVDEGGLVTAVGRGEAVIRASSADGFSFDECPVSVRFSLFHWLRALFGR